jgi:hypothetical protein
MSYVDSVNGITYTLSGTNATVTAYDVNVTTTPTILSTFVDGGVTYTVNALTANVFGSNTCTSINIPATITTIPDYCFQENRVLTTVTLNGNIAIGRAAFKNCVNLSVFDFSYLTSIGIEGFAGAGSATTFASPANMPNITSFGVNGFNNSGVTSITFGPNITTFGSIASSATQLTSVVVQATGQLTFADDNFQYISTTLTFTFENSTVVPNLEKNSFFNVTTIVFNGTNYTNEEFLVFTENLYVDPVHGIKYGIDKSNNSASIFGYDHTISTTPILKSSFVLSSVTYSMVVIDYAAFYQNTNITEVTIPAEIVLIGSYAFRDCTNLIKVTFLGQTLPSLQTGATLLNIHPNAVAHVYTGVATTAIDSRFASIEFMINYNVPDSSTITNAISGNNATLTTISNNDLTDTAVIGTTATEQRDYTKNLLASLITNYTTELSGKQLKLSGVTLPGFENSGDKDIIVVSTAAGSTLDNTVNKSDITSNNVYAVIEENESISLPTHTSTLTVAKTGATTYDITYNGTTTVSNTGDTITQDGLTVILGSVLANLSVQNVDILFTNHLAESVTAAAATIPGFTTTMTSDATVECTGPAATVFQNTFYFKTDSDIATTSTDDVNYYVDLSSWTTVAADLNASTNGTISLANGAFVDGESISESFLRHLANTLFGTHLGVDLFNNETTVKTDLLTSTATLATTIQTAISDISVSGSDGDLLGSAGDKYLDDNVSSTKNITREMINQLLNNANSRERFNASNLASYIKGGQAGCYSVPFLPDDTISYKVTINPNASQDTDVPVGPNTTARSFRVKMKLT